VLGPGVLKPSFFNSLLVALNGGLAFCFGRLGLSMPSGLLSGLHFSMGVRPLSQGSLTGPSFFLRSELNGGLDLLIMTVMFGLSFAQLRLTLCNDSVAVLLSLVEKILPTLIKLVTVAFNHGFGLFLDSDGRMELAFHMA